MAQPIRVAVIEDDPVLRDTLRQLLEQAAHCEWVGGWASGSEALRHIAGAAPDVILLDINLGTENGIASIPMLKDACPRSQVLMLTVYEDNENIFQALAAGATGYLVKRTPGPRLLEAISELYAGESRMSGHIARKVVESLDRSVPARPSTPRLSLLTQREHDVLGCLAEGCLYKEAAERLGMTIHTVRTHIRAIYEKLKVHSRTEAVVKFLNPQ